MPHSNPEKRREYMRKRYSEQIEKERAYNREKYLRHKEKYNARAKKYYENNKELVLQNSRKSHLKNSYGLSVEEYQQMVEDQQNRCAICHKHEIRITKMGTIKPLSVDHCHITGKVRALLCNDCNSALGYIHEDIDRLKEMIIYIERFAPLKMR